MSTPPRGTVTFFFTDIQGSTRLWERDAKRMQRALARHDEIMKATVEAHGGYVFKMVGDACCAAFASAPKALEAALAAQRAILTEPWDEECKIRVRMALHTGVTEERDSDYFGPPVNRIARLLSSGHGGQTLVSQATRELVDGHLPEGVSLRDMGERRLKDLEEPERIFQLLSPDLPSEFPPLKTLETSSNEDRYRLIEKIGSGGMAEVYLAYDEFLQREVAFKVLDRQYAENREATERFRCEAKSAVMQAHNQARWRGSATSDRDFRASLPCDCALCPRSAALHLLAAVGDEVLTADLVIRDGVVPAAAVNAVLPRPYN